MLDQSGVGDLMRIAVERGRGDEARPEDRHLRRARRRARLGRVLPRARARLRLVLAVPGAARPARGCAGRAREQGATYVAAAADGDRRGRPALARDLAARVARRRTSRRCARSTASTRLPLPPVSRRPRRPRRCGGVRKLGVRRRKRLRRSVGSASRSSAGDRATCEYWAVVRSEGREQTIAGVSLIRFDDDGLVVSQRDYWSVEDGRREPPEGWGR